MTDCGYLPREKLAYLFEALNELQYIVMGPQLIDGVIQYKQINNSDELPSGLIDQQTNGSYRINQTNNSRLFEWCNGPQAIKPLVFKPREAMWQVGRGENSLAFSQVLPDQQKYAVIGVRACDVAALTIQDQHFLQRDLPDPFYQARRKNLLTIAVNCVRAAQTCFCVSTGDGPKVTRDYDIALSELDEGYVIEWGSELGQAVCKPIDLMPVTTSQIQQIESGTKNASQQQRALPNADYITELFRRHDHAHWDEVAARCLSCGNCTMVCPTCFCFATEQESAPDGTQATQFRHWDSCFSRDHSYIHGIVIREQTQQRYRQWITHKFSSWAGQYGRIGCVGCGRCISWCPVGIDVTEEISAIVVDEVIGEANA